MVSHLARFADGGVRPLDDYRVLDLTSGHFRLTGSILAHLGMTVFQPLASIEDELRTVDDWYETSGKHVWVPDRPLPGGAWLEAFDALVTDETTGSRWGVDAATAREMSACLSICHISPWGTNGPDAAIPASELILQARAGAMWTNGYEDRSPLPLPGNQAAYQASAQAAVAILAAIYGQAVGMPGQVIDVSAHEAMANAVLTSKPWWSLARTNMKRSHLSAIAGAAATRLVWPASDGYICWRLSLGVGAAARLMRTMVEWMEADTGRAQSLRAVNWGSVNVLEVTAETLRAWECEFEEFFRTKTRAELFDGARARDLLLMPILSIEEILVDRHVAERQSLSSMATPLGTIELPAFPPRVNGRQVPRRAAVLDDRAPGIGGRAATSSAGPAPSKPLEGLRVLDFGWVIAGPATTRVLGMLGATVVKVESNSRLDPTRASPPFAGKPSRDRSGVFSMHNNNKLSLTLDLNRDGSRAVVKRLVEWADVVCENYAAGQLERWGLGPETMHTWNPGAIILRSSTWGQEGPYRDAPGNGIVLAGFAGYDHLLGWPDRPPLPPGEPYLDMISPWFAASSIIAALLSHREAKSITIDIAQLDCALNFLGPQLALASLGSPSARTGGRRPVGYPSGVFPAAGDDEWVALSIESEAEWRAACDLIPGLVDRYSAGSQATRDVSASVYATLERFLASRPAAATVREFASVGLPVVQVARPEDLFVDRQLHRRGHFVELDHPAMGKFLYEMPSFRFDGIALDVHRSPTIGEHCGEVLGDLLGYSPDAIADLLAEGIVN